MKNSLLNKEDYIRGWKDCRSYNGSEVNATKAYNEGFGACLDAYFKSPIYVNNFTKSGWECVTKTPRTIPAKVLTLSR